MAINPHVYPSKPQNFIELTLPLLIGLKWSTLYIMDLAKNVFIFRFLREFSEDHSYWIQDNFQKSASWSPKVDSLFYSGFLYEQSNRLWIWNQWLPFL